MSLQTASVCFIDIKDSTQKNVEIGNIEMNEMKKEFIRVSSYLAKSYGCSSPKDTGDGLMSWFSNSIKAIQFATEVFYIFQDKPGLLKHFLIIKAGVAHGEIEICDNVDIKGNAVNQAARIESVSDANSILINSEMTNSISSNIGKDEAAQYIVQTKSEDLKGFGKTDLYDFDWNAFEKANNLVAKRVVNALKNCCIQRNTVEPEKLAKGGLIIWPVVPRFIATAIHKAQLEIIRVLSILNWETTLLIADCGNFEISADDARIFGTKLLKHEESAGVKINNVQLMSDLFGESSSKASRLRSHFESLSSTLKVNELIEFEEKTYQDPDKYKNSEILDFLRPILTGATVLHFAAENNNKEIIILAGYDEDRQWQKIIDTRQKWGQIGFVMNDMLKKKEGENEYLYRQRTEGPNWGDESECVREMSSTNLGYWLFQHFALLPNFPEDNVLINNKPFNLQNWVDSYNLPDMLEPMDLVNHVWEKIKRK